MKKNKSKIDITKVVITILVLSEVLYIIMQILTRSVWLQGYMVNDFSNSEMDFFNMLALIGTGDPYSKASNYPALCFIILKFFYHIVPLDVVFSEQGCDGFFLRNYMPVQIAYTVAMMALVIVIFEIVRLYFKREHIFSMLIAVAIVGCGPMVFAVERGNFVLLAFLGSLIYIVLYDHPNKKVRMIAYISLAMAAAIKIYPAALGILTLSQKRYRETLLLGGIGILVFLLPFFDFEGITSIQKMIGGLVASVELQGNAGSGYNFSMLNISRIIQLLIGSPFSPSIEKAFKLVAIIFPILIYMSSKEEWKKCFSMILLMVWLPEFSYTYMLVFFILPFIMMIKKQMTEKTSIYICYVICFALILMPYCLPVLTSLDFPDAKFPVTVSTIIINFVIVILSVLVFVNNLIGRRNRCDLAS